MPSITTLHHTSHHRSQIWIVTAIQFVCNGSEGKRNCASERSDRTRTQIRVRRESGLIGEL